MVYGYAQWRHSRALWKLPVALLIGLLLCVGSGATISPLEVDIDDDPPARGASFASGASPGGLPSVRRLVELAMQAEDHNECSRDVLLKLVPDDERVCVSAPRGYVGAAGQVCNDEVPAVAQAIDIADADTLAFLRDCFDEVLLLVFSEWDAHVEDHLRALAVLRGALRIGGHMKEGRCAAPLHTTAHFAGREAMSSERCPQSRVVPHHQFDFGSLQWLYRRTTHAASDPPAAGTASSMMADERCSALTSCLRQPQLALVRSRAAGSHEVGRHAIGVVRRTALSLENFPAALSDGPSPGFVFLRRHFTEVHALHQTFLAVPSEPRLASPPPTVAVVPSALLDFVYLSSKSSLVQADMAVAEALLSRRTRPIVAVLQVPHNPEGGVGVTDRELSDEALQHLRTVVHATVPLLILRAENQDEAEPDWWVRCQNLSNATAPPTATAMLHILQRRWPRPPLARGGYDGQHSSTLSPLDVDCSSIAVPLPTGPPPGAGNEMQRSTVSSWLYRTKVDLVVALGRVAAWQESVVQRVTGKSLQLEWASLRALRGTTLSYRAALQRAAFVDEAAGLEQPGHWGEHPRWVRPGGVLLIHMDQSDDVVVRNGIPRPAPLTPHPCDQQFRHLVEVYGGLGADDSPPTSTSESPPMTRVYRFVSVHEQQRFSHHLRRVARASRSITWEGSTERSDTGRCEVVAMFCSGVVRHLQLHLAELHMLFPPHRFVEDIVLHGRRNPEVEPPPVGAQGVSYRSKIRRHATWERLPTEKEQRRLMVDLQVALRQRQRAPSAAARGAASAAPPVNASSSIGGWRAALLDHPGDVGYRPRVLPLPVLVHPVTDAATTLVAVLAPVSYGTVEVALLFDSSCALSASAVKVYRLLRYCNGRAARGIHGDRDADHGDNNSNDDDDDDSILGVSQRLPSVTHFTSFDVSELYHLGRGAAGSGSPWWRHHRRADPAKAALAHVARREAARFRPPQLWLVNSTHRAVTLPSPHYWTAPSSAWGSGRHGDAVSLLEGFEYASFPTSALAALQRRWQRRRACMAQLIEDEVGRRDGAFRVGVRHLV